MDQVTEDAARLAGFKPGDEVLMVNDTTVADSRQFLRLEKELFATQPVLVKRSDVSLFLPLKAGGR